MARSGIMGRDMERNYSWRKENLKRVDFYLNKKNESDVIEHLDKQPNRREYLINLIRKDIEETR